MSNRKNKGLPDINVSLHVPAKVWNDLLTIASHYQISRRDLVISVLIEFHSKHRIDIAKVEEMSWERSERQILILNRSVSKAPVVE